MYSVQYKSTVYSLSLSVGLFTIYALDSILRDDMNDDDDGEFNVKEVGGVETDSGWCQSSLCNYIITTVDTLDTLSNWQHSPTINHQQQSRDNITHYSPVSQLRLSSIQRTLIHQLPQLLGL